MTKRVAIPRPCWELRGKRGSYGVVFVGRNGEQMLGNKVQGYVEKRDALHVLEVLYGAKAWATRDGGWHINRPEFGFTIAIRDATDKAGLEPPAIKPRGPVE